MGGVEMPWLPDFTNALELARLQTRAAGQADPVAQYVAALNSGDTHALEAVWPAEGGRLRPPLWRGPWPQAASGVRQPQPILADGTPRPYRDRGVDGRRREGRGGAAGPPGRGQGGSSLAGGGGGRIPRRSVGGVPQLLQPVASLWTARRQAPHTRAPRLPLRWRRGSLPLRARRRRHRCDREHLRGKWVPPRAHRAQLHAPRHP